MLEMRRTDVKILDVGGFESSLNRYILRLCSCSTASSGSTEVFDSSSHEFDQAKNQGEPASR
jgi:hypothetical protein